MFNIIKSNERCHSQSIGDCSILDKINHSVQESEGKMDRRTRKTKKIIQDTYLSLLKEKPIHKMTISEITDLADIGRGTFYTHYLDIYDLHRHVIDEKSHELLSVFDATYPSDQINDFRTFCQNIITFVSDNRTVFQLLVEEDNNMNDLSKLKEQLIVKIMAIERLNPNDMENYIAVSFAIAGIISVLSDWLNAVIPVEREELTDILNKLIVDF